jgi:hypothetical protein
LNDDEFGMLNWFSEFPEQDAFDDAAVQCLLVKGLLTDDGNRLQLSPLGKQLLASRNTS